MCSVTSDLRKNYFFLRIKLKKTVKKIYEALKKTEKQMASRFSYIKTILPEDIFFITSQELLDMYPDSTPKEREYKITKDKGAVFLMKVGGKLSNGEKHDGRAPDYDDWSLNGDLFFYLPALDMALEISSMGIRVDEDSIKSQCKASYCEGRLTLPYHQMILNKELPYTIGGGIGQSRLCMYLLKKVHIGEVQSSYWPEEDIKEFKKYNVNLL